MTDAKPDPKSTGAESWSRRDFIAGATAVAAMAGGGGGVWWWSTRGSRNESSVFIGQSQTYDDGLADVIQSGLNEIGVTRSQVAGKCKNCVKERTRNRCACRHRRSLPRYGT